MLKIKKFVHKKTYHELEFVERERTILKGEKANERIGKTIHGWDDGPDTDFTRYPFFNRLRISERLKELFENLCFSSSQSSKLFLCL